MYSFYSKREFLKRRRRLGEKSDQAIALGAP